MEGAPHPTLLESISAWVLVVTFALRWPTSSGGRPRRLECRATTR